MARKASAVEAKDALRASQLQEVQWMRAALEAADLNERTFRAYLGLISKWPDRQILALARVIFPNRGFSGRIDALAALDHLHRDLSRLLVELEEALA